MTNQEYASAEASAELKLWVAEAPIRPKLKIAPSFVHYAKARETFMQFIHSTSKVSDLYVFCIMVNIDLVVQCMKMYSQIF